jgi:hypothetical protein
MAAFISTKIMGGEKACVRKKNGKKKTMKKNRKKRSGKSLDR